MTPKQRAAAEKVIEAWEGPYYDSIEFVGGMRVAIDALREALAEPEQDVIQAAVNDPIADKYIYTWYPPKPTRWQKLWAFFKRFW